MSSDTYTFFKCCIDVHNYEDGHVYVCCMVKHGLPAQCPDMAKGLATPLAGSEKKLLLDSSDDKGQKPILVIT